MSPLKEISQPQTTKDLTLAKLTDLRSLMTNHQLNGYLIPAVDEHLNLSLPEALQRRAWVSGFTGSAGDLLLLHDTAWLFVDSRYHEQAALEVDPSLISVSKLGLDGHLTLLETLEKLGKQTSFHLGFDPFTLSVEQFHDFLNRLLPEGVQLSLVENLVDIVRSQNPWVELEPLPAYGQSQLFHLPNNLTGETTEQKLARVREGMQKLKTDILPITNLNQVAWLFNLRGGDIPHIPLFIAYAVITLDAAFLFTNLERISAEVQQALANHVTLKPYQLYQETLQVLASQPNKPHVILDPKHTTTGTYQILLREQSDDGTDGVQIVLAANPIEGMKARKNAVEIEQMKLANFKASRAKVRTLKWTSEKLAEGEFLNELDVAVAMERFYRQEADFHSLSFQTISATGSNSSIVHYKTPNPKEVLKPGSLLLLDSGAQYLAGTTDDTRTIIVGEPTKLQIERYTTVLIAHINCAMQKFPRGTTGIQLDAIARSALWLLGLDYRHGTGHGVGAFLSGHEGPLGISKHVQEPLEPGMVVSIEPGFYETGWGGIRIENLYVVKHCSPENGSAWYEFESLTYIPFDKKLIDLNRLSPQQREWLEQYNQAVIQKLAPSLDSTEVLWLKEACSF